MNPYVLNRPLVVKRGWICETTSNVIEAYVGEWAVLRMDNGVEVRVPLDHGIDNGIIVARDRYELNN